MLILTNWLLVKRTIFGKHFIYSDISYTEKRFVSPIVGFKRDNNYDFSILFDTDHNQHEHIILGSPSLNFVLESLKHESEYHCFFKNLDRLEIGSVLIL
jgi:hypothetical protein